MKQRLQGVWKRVVDVSPIRKVGASLLVVAIVLALMGYLNQHGNLYLGDTLYHLLGDFYANTSAELASIAITVLIIDALIQRREQEQEKRDLILQLGSPDNAFAREALRIIRARKWLNDGSLYYAHLVDANLEDADLMGANLKGADLNYANLEGANSTGAILEGAHLTNANLKGANLIKANLDRANLSGADLSGADLRYANLIKANLKGANLEGANLINTKLSDTQLASVKSLAGATMSDGTIYDGWFYKNDE